MAVAARDASGPLAAEAAGRRRRSLAARRSRRRLAERHEQPADLVARHVVAALVGDAEALAQHLHRLVAPVELAQRGAEQLVDLGELRAELQRTAKRLHGL